MTLVMQMQAISMQAAQQARRLGVASGLRRPARHRSPRRCTPGREPRKRWRRALRQDGFILLESRARDARERDPRRYMIVDGNNCLFAGAASP